MGKLLGALVTASMIGAGPASSATPLAPNGPWNVEQHPDTCILSRAYGPIGDTRLGFQPIVGRKSVELIIVQPGTVWKTSNGDGTVIALPRGTASKQRYTRFGVKQNKVAITRIALDQDMFDALPQTTGLEVNAGPVKATFTIADAAKAVPAQRRCIDGLIKSWGVDPALVDSNRRPTPKENVSRFFTENDYPADAIAARYIGNVVAILNVDAAGAVKGCRVTLGGGKVLNDATCRQASLIPFEPATDDAGKAAPSIFVLSIRWTMSQFDD